MESIDEGGDLTQAEMLRAITGIGTTLNFRLLQVHLLSVRMYFVATDSERREPIHNASFVVYDLGPTESVKTNDFTSYEVGANVAVKVEGRVIFYSTDQAEEDNPSIRPLTSAQKSHSAILHCVAKEEVVIQFISGGHIFLGGYLSEEKPFCTLPQPPTPRPTPSCPYPLDHRAVSFDLDEFQVISKTAGRFKNVLKSSGQWLDLIVETTDDAGRRKQTKLLNRIKGLGPYVDFFFKKDEALNVKMYLVESDTDELTPLSDLSYVVYDIGGSENVLTEGFENYKVESAVTVERKGPWVNFIKKSGVDPTEVENLNGTKPTLEQKRYSATIHFVNKDTVRFTFGSWRRMGHNFVAGVWREPFCPPSARQHQRRPRQHQRRPRPYQRLLRALTLSIIVLSVSTSTSFK